MKERHPRVTAEASLWQSIGVETSARTEIKNITAALTRVVSEARIETGICHLYVPHTTAGILVNESDDPDVARDIGETLDRLVPRGGAYKHYEGNADSHIKASLVGSSTSIPVEGGELALGRWQGVFFCEFDGPRRRTVKVRVTNG